MRICVVGGGGGGSYKCSVKLEDILNTYGFDVYDITPVRRQNFKMKIDILKLESKFLLMILNDKGQNEYKNKDCNYNRKSFI